MINYKLINRALVIYFFSGAVFVSAQINTLQQQNPLSGLGSIPAGGSNKFVGDIIKLSEPLPQAPNRNSGYFQNLDAIKSNEFQKYILETSGALLPLFGISFFENNILNQNVRQNGFNNPTETNPFSPVETSQVSEDYLIGPGDQIKIKGWGSLEVDVSVVVDRNGNINIPKIGVVPVSGTKFSQLEGVIKSSFGKNYKDFQMVVSLGQLRTISISVVGEARRPGSYVVSGTSTLASAFFATAGPKSTGSMRRVQLKRNGKILVEFDLYSFLTKGNIEGNIKLIDNDIIFIPPALGHVALLGKVNNPAIYEIKSFNESLDNLLNFAGGVSITADPRRVLIERLNPRDDRPRKIIDIVLNDDGLKTTLINGDIISIQGISNELANSIVLRGNVAQPTRAPWRVGMRIRDMIKDKGYLISKDSIRRQNEILFDNNQLERTQREREIISEDLLDDQVLDIRIDQKGLSDARLKELAISEKNQNNDPKLIESNFYGVVNNKDLENKQNFINQAPKNIESFREARQARVFSNMTPVKINENNKPQSIVDSVGKLIDEINWEYAVIERVNRNDLNVKLLSFNLGKILANENDPDNHLLEPGDIINVFSISDIRVPISKRRIIVRIEGEVKQPGIYQAAQNETLVSLIQRAGGLTYDAYLFGTLFYREDVRRSQTDNLQKLLRKLEYESSGQLVQASQSLGGGSDPAVTQAKILAAQRAQKMALERVRNLKPEGRIALNLMPQEANYINKLPDIRLQNNDKIVIPERPDFVYVYGAVNTESALIFKNGLKVKEYLNLAGVSSAADRDSVILVRADGSALTSNTSWFNSVNEVLVMPGDAIVMPDKLDREASWSAIVRNAKDITQIFYQLGLGAAGLKALGY